MKVKVYSLFAAVAIGLAAGAAMGDTIAVSNGDSIADAIAGASNGDTILVAPGTYEITSQITVDKPITLISSDGPEVTVIRAASDKYTADSNRALLVKSAATISGFTIEQNASSLNGDKTAITVYINAADAVLTNCVVRGNGKYYDKRVKGGGIYMDKAATIADCVVSDFNFRGTRGGGVYMSSGKIVDSTIYGCRSGGTGNGEWNYGTYGTGLMMWGASTASGCVISNNVSAYYMGAGVCMKSSNAILTNCVVTCNHTRYVGGAGVFNYQGKVIDCTITDNTALATGLRSDYQWLDGTVKGTTCTSLLPPGDGNVWTHELPDVIPTQVYCSLDGAGIFPYDTPETASTNATLAAEAACAFARASGETVKLSISNGVHYIYSSLNITDPVFVEGVSPTNTEIVAKGEANICRAMRVTADGSTIANLRFYGKQAVCSSDGDLTLSGGGYRGGGMLLEADSLVTNCVFRGLNNNNTAQMDGGAIYASKGHIVDCEVRANSSVTKGLVYLNGTAEIDACRITDNKCGYGYSNQDNFSPGLYLNGSSIARNCLVARNVGIYGTAGMTIAGSGAKAYHCTVVSNYASKVTSGTGLLIGNGQARNCVFASNFAGKALADIQKNGGSVSYCLSGAAVSGTGNIVGTPSFADFDGGDYHLARGSAGIDACSSTYDIAVDMDGTARPLDGDGDDVALSDMGCYEFVMADGMTFSVTNGAAGIGSTAASFKPVIRHNGAVLSDYSGVVFKWTFASQAAGTDVVEGTGASYAELDRVFDVPGSYDISLSVTMPDDTVYSYAIEGAVKVYVREMFAACDGSSEPCFPYATPQTAANDLDDIAAAAVAGSLDAGLSNVVFRLLGEGSFALDSTVDAAYGLSIVGLGPDTTKIVPGPGFGSRAFNANGDFAISGVTLYNFAPINAQSGGGLNIAAPSGSSVLVTNCVFDACRTVGNPEGGALCVNSHADIDIVDCIIRNTLSSMPAWRSSVYLNGSNVLMDRCVVTNNCSGDAGWNGQCISGVKLGSSAVMRNCLVADNCTWQVQSVNNGRGAAVQVNGAASVENCTIVSNRTMYAKLDSAVGVYVEGGTVVNCVIADNYDFGKSELRDVTDPGHRISYSAVEGIDYGEGNIADHVVFKSVPDRDWRLTGSSAGVGAGLNADWMLAATDLLGNPRKLGARVDMGCYEAAPGGTILLLR